MSHGPVSRVHRGWWAAGAAIVALVPFAGGLSATRVFFVGDLGMYFWPRHLSLLHSWRAGEWPWWDPFAGAGQSAAANALNQFFLVPVTLVRLLLPDVPGFNVWVAAPFPLLAAGTWLWLRRWLSPGAAFVGAATLAVSGPVLSSGNYPNFSWTVAAIPWVLWAVDRLIERADAARVGALAAAVAVQALGGEPITLGGTVAIAIGYAVGAVPAHASGERARRAARVALGVGVGALLAAIQLIPLGTAAAGSPRDGHIDAMFWSLHPLALVETWTGHLFGHSYYGSTTDLPWVGPLNSGRDPLLYSIYVGIPVFAVAAIGAASSRLRRWRRFWWAVAAVAVVMALGEHTFVYRALHEHVPLVASFRFPVKFLVFFCVALAALVASGVDELSAHARGRLQMRTPRIAVVLTALVAVAAGVLGAAAAREVPWALHRAEELARAVGIAAPAAAAKWLVAVGAPMLIRVAMMAAGGLLLLGIVWRRHRWAVPAAALLGALAIADPLAVNLDLHPTIEASALGPPAWVGATKPDAGARVYIGGHIVAAGAPRRGRGDLIDAAQTYSTPISESRLAAAAALTAQFAYVPSAWGVREVISYDLPTLWPREYHLMLKRFRDATPEARRRFIGRVGTRYCFLPEPPVPGAFAVVPPTPPSAPMALYACHSDTPRRAHIADSAIVEPDHGRQLDRLFEAAVDPWSALAIEAHAPAAAGRAGVARQADARIVVDDVDRVVIAAAVASDDGYLALADSYDPWWQVAVDGQPAPLLRANGMFRAVRLTPGEHVVEMRYRPVPLYAGMAVSALTALVLLGCVVADSRRQRPARRPHAARSAA